MPPETDDDDSTAFREAMRGVRPIRGSGRADAPPPRPEPRARQRELDDAAVMQELRDGPLGDPGDVLSYRGPGIQDSVFTRLRRGTYRIDRELDLHGLRSEEAKAAIVRFLAECRDRGARCVRIVHGKGLRSKGAGPVLKQRLDGWLRQRSDVLAFVSARPEDGGTGAVYVMLRAPERG